MLPYLIAGAIGYGIAKLFEEDKSPKYADGGSVLLAPNGKPSNLTPEKYKLVRTKSFKDWFGDWQNDPANASKVVDENGEPMICFHGAYDFGFTIFSKKTRGISTGSKSAKKGFFFYDKEKDAKMFSKRSASGGIYEVFLKMKIPNIKNYDNQNVDADKELLKLINSFEYDGAIALNLKDGYEIGNQYIVFEPEQIKLADGTNTTFDGNNPDIRFDGGGEVYSKEYIYKRIESVLKMYKNLDEEEYSEIENNLYNFSNQDFPVGLYNLPKQIKLYRIIYLKSEKDFNKDNLGVHFIADKKLINDDFLWSIGITKKEYKKLYLISINVDSKYINIDWTLSYKARYPNEFEFTLKDNSKYEVESIEKYNPDIRYAGGGNIGCDYFKSQTSMPYYDEIIMGHNKKVQYKIVNIRIDDYFKLIRDENGKSYSKEYHLSNLGVRKDKVVEIMIQMKKGVKYDMPIYDFTDGFQEGRHRLIASNNLGCKYVSVALFGNNIDNELIKLGIQYINIPDIRFNGGGEITNFREFYDRLKIQDGTKYIGKKFTDVFQYLKRSGSSPHKYRLIVKQYENALKRLSEDNYSTKSMKQADVNKIERMKPNINKQKYLAKFYCDNTGRIIDFKK
jgi:hypothetical protein